ncbi:hypothetical protein SAMN05216330_104146 [Bradyrhizobium sp. Ghvi]|uniref:hypothetical protein n=1 Tax=Bradyrhizobium sp. Ghvi TaxID=1855319 RepID=UPI0008E77263|nr:hypothetical protein [Bradyrhizobium sp. Ghvi]SFO68113.1 hypothetical protein SAMN05216330_104146 [Bradyrhizobium sp. Ghvi]
MQIALVKRLPKRRCRIPRRPHPNLDYFFGRLKRTDRAFDKDAGSGIRLATPTLRLSFPD